MASNLDYARQVADVVLQMGNTKAQAALNRGNAWAPAIRQIPRTLGDWAAARDARQVNAQNQQVRDLQLASATRENERSMADWTDEQQIRALGPLVGTDPAAMAREVSAINPLKAGPFQQQVNEQQKQQAQLVANFTQSVLNAPVERRPQLWAGTRAAMMAAKVPAAEALPEAYDDVFVTSLHDQALSRAGGTVQPKPVEELVAVDEGGVSTYRPRSQAVGKPQYRAPTRKTPAAPGSLEYEMEAEARDLRKPVEALTRAERDRVRARVASAGREPAGEKAITRAEQAGLRRWRADQLNDLEDRRRRSRGTDALTGLPIPPMTDGEYASARQRIEAAYNESMGIVAQGPPVSAGRRRPPQTAVQPWMPPPTTATLPSGRPPTSPAPAVPVAPVTAAVVPQSTTPPQAPRRPIPGIPGAEAELRNGRWVRVK